MSAIIEQNSSVDAFGLEVAPRHIKVMMSSDRILTSELRPRTLGSIDELKRIVDDYPYFPRPSPISARQDTYGGVQVPPRMPSLYDLPASSPAARSLASDEPPSITTSFLWVDLKAPSEEECETVLSWLPLHRLTTEHSPDDGADATAAADAEGEDHIEYFPAQGYAYLTLTGTPPGHADEDAAVVTFLLFDAFLLTVSEGDYVGEASVAESAVAAANEGGPVSISSIFSAMVSSLVLQTQSKVAALMVDVDQLDELVLQIQPSEMDLGDLLGRIRGTRHRVSRYHTSLLRKERVLKQLQLPILRHSAVCRDAGCVERYQRTLALIRRAVEKLRRGRDTTNLSCMNLVSGVSARLVEHSHWMDYLNHVQSQIALVVMPVAVIPGLWAMNVSVPWMGTTKTVAFWCITAVTIGLLALGLAYPIARSFMYAPPGALVPSID